MAFSLPSIGYISEMTRVGRAGNVAQLRALADQVAGKHGEALLAHIGLRCDRRDEATHELQVAVDIALELGTQKVDLGQHVRARDLICHEPVLIVRKNAAARYHHHGHRRWNIRRGENGLAYVAIADPEKGQRFANLSTFGSVPIGRR